MTASNPRIRASAAAGRSLPGVSTTVKLTPLDDRGRELLDRLEAGTTPPFRWDDRTGARSYWINADGAPTDGYEAALDRLAPDWRASVRIGIPPWRRRLRAGAKAVVLAELQLLRLSRLADDRVAAVLGDPHIPYLGDEGFVQWRAVGLKKILYLPRLLVLSGPTLYPEPLLTVTVRPFSQPFFFAFTSPWNAGEEPGWPPIF